MSSLTKIFNTGAFTQDLQAKSFARNLTRFLPGSGSAPLYALTSYGKREKTVSTEHGFFTKTKIFPSVTLTAAVSATDTVFPVVSTNNILPNMVLQLGTENVIVDSVVSGTALRVTRGVGTSPAASALAGASAYKIGTAHEQGSIRPNPNNIKPVRITNFTQIFRNTWAITGTAAEVQVIAGDSTPAESEYDAIDQHATDIETALFFSQKSQGNRNGQPFSTMDGLLSSVNNIDNYPDYYAVPNTFTAGSTTNYTQLEAMVDTCFNQSVSGGATNKRVAFCGSKALVVLNNICRLNAQYEIYSGETEYGLSFSTIRLTRGEIMLVEHPIFNTNPVWSKMAVILEPSTFNVAYLGNRDTKRDPIMDDNGRDAQGGTYTTELTCLVKNPPANAVIYGLTAAEKG